MAGEGFGIGHAAPTLVEQHALWAALGPRDQALRSWTVLTADRGLDGVPPSLAGLLPLIAHNLESADDVAFAGHLSGFRRRCVLMTGLATAQAARVLDHLDGLDVCVVGDLALASQVAGGTHPVQAIHLWSVRGDSSAVARRLDLAAGRRPAKGLATVADDGPVPVHIASGAPPYLGPPAGPVDPDRWWATRVPLDLGTRPTWSLGPTESLLHTWAGFAWRPDRARAVADIHLLMDRPGVDLDGLVGLAGEVGVAGALRTSLPYLRQVFGAAPYAEVERLLVAQGRTVGELAVRWIDRPVAGVGPAPNTAIGYFALLGATGVPGRHGIDYVRRRQELAGAGPGLGDSFRRMSRRPGTGIDRALVALARGALESGTTKGVELDRPVTDLDVDQLLDRVEWHRIEGVARKALADESTPAALADRLRLAQHRARRSHLAALAELRRVDERLDQPFLVVKGPVLAGMYGDAGTRSYVDLDLLVGDAGFGSAQESLQAAGYRPTVDPDANQDAFDQVPYRRPGGLEIDLHRSLLASPHRRRRTAASAAELIDRSVPVVLGGQQYRTLDPADTVVHLAVHAATSGADRLIWLVDLALALDGAGVTDDLLVERAAEWQAGPDLAFMFIRLAETLDVPVRPALMKRLESSPGFDRLARLMIRAFPVERSSGRFTPARHVARHARPTATATAAAAVTDQLHRGESLVRAMLPTGGRS